MSTEDLRVKILALRHEVHNLQNRNLELANQYKEVIKENVELKQENKKLQDRINSLEDKLNINSSNSGLPSSKDVYRIERGSRPRSGLKPGGQPGHKYSGYEFKTPNEVIRVIPKGSVCKCGGELIVSEEYSAHQKIEIPQVKPIVTEYRLHNSRCSKCHKEYKSSLEDYKLLGQNTESIISSLSGFYNNSKREIQSILKEIFNLEISLGLISASEDRVSGKLEGKYKELISHAQNSDYLHLDESSANNKGKRGWCWVAASKAVTIFKLASSRGAKVVEQLLPEYEGKVITDRYGAYNIFAQENRQVCHAHLRRDFKRFAHSRNVSLSKVGHSLIDITTCVFGLYHGYKTEKIGKLYYLRRMRKIKKKMLYYLKTVSGIEECEAARRVAHNILKSFDMMWTFIEDERLEPTNNFAERQIKHHVKYRKNSLFTWSDRGQRFIERMKSVYATAKLQKLNPHQLILDLI